MMILNSQQKEVLKLIHVYISIQIGECPLAFSYYRTLSTTSSIKRSPTIIRSHYLFEHQLLAFPSPHVVFVLSQIPYILWMCFINISQTTPGGKNTSDTLIHNSNQVFIYTQNGHLIAPTLYLLRYYAINTWLFWTGK